MSRILIVEGIDGLGNRRPAHPPRLQPRRHVMEEDPPLRHSSTMLSAGNVRIQFDLEETIVISQCAMEYMEHFAEDLAVGDLSPDPQMRKQVSLFRSMPLRGPRSGDAPRDLPLVEEARAARMAPTQEAAHE